ncbi:hypothetical protein GCM10017771_80280 [Streptomyces capitiformicae]|uniref:Uncharacterized protein n=1 Tax=Streptomyces capitiformicae TaxID=2014920 RepID=A0A919DMI0_9ACTN|nr:hypothetical protein GCM10017771_80280 [Streptomyces capitiformicae]
MTFVPCAGPPLPDLPWPMPRRVRAYGAYSRRPGRQDWAGREGTADRAALPDQSGTAGPGTHLCRVGVTLPRAPTEQGDSIAPRVARRGWSLRSSEAESGGS